MELLVEFFMDFTVNHQSFAMLSTCILHGFFVQLSCAIMDVSGYLHALLHALAMDMVSSCLVHFQFLWEFDVKLARAGTLQKSIRGTQKVWLSPVWRTDKF